MAKIICEAVECLFNRDGECIKPVIKLDTERNEVRKDGELVSLRMICTDYR